MTREEQRNQAALDFANNQPDIQIKDAFTRNLCIALGQAFRDGAEWADKTMLDKACEWLKCAEKYHWYDPIKDDEGFNTEQLISDFRKAMEE